MGDLISQLLSKSRTEISAGTSVELSLVTPGQKEPSFVRSFDDVPLKAKVQLWQTGTSGPAIESSGRRFELTVIGSADLGVAEGTQVVVACGNDLYELQSALGSQLGFASPPQVMMYVHSLHSRSSFNVLSRSYCVWTGTIKISANFADRCRLPR